jgi:hypothetical protein
LELQNDPKGKFKFFSLIQDYHAISACLKANGGYWGTEALELCRRSLGGHAYSAYNAIAGHIGDYGVLTTGGGDNIVLAQQHARYLFSCYKNAIKGKKIIGSLSFFNDYQNILSKSFTTNKSEDVLNVDFQTSALKYLTLRLLETLHKKVSQDFKSGKSNDEVWNDHMMELIDISKVHFYVFCFESFNEELKKLNNPTIKDVVLDLFCLFVLKAMEIHFGFLLQYECISSVQIEWIRNEILLLCKKVRINAVSLVDAFNHPDFVIKSPLGKFEPSYEDYFKTITESSHEISPNYWEREIKPLTSKI